MLDISVKETRLYQEGYWDGYKEGYREGLQEGKANVILRVSQKLLGELPETVSAQIRELTIEELDALCDLLPDFSTLTELQDWL
ncbi:DUF4351 domain-containing protein [cf. Phormidesmis sp. LEGE 11477]|uniref:DUF4351 domain-containing protein n=1 Tax=cf. Phormidesmis sp. LEGE 11477 TaxID=1828680 RepID=UPI0018817160|nr:DUF4351 domain-containing protein [cf. Phormidesmis sp. LEGE 11477]MBE9062894.1 DUF4351 domain-containing protein [cf. Phormidesmis sp. LEGE 11477]